MGFSWKEKDVYILGTKYNVLFSSNENKYTTLKKSDGYTDSTIKQIVVRDEFDTECFDTVKDIDFVIRNNIRHEIIHAFLYESGLDCNSNKANSWATNEECVDWIAVQFPKILEVYKELEVI